MIALQQTVPLTCVIHLHSDSIPAGTSYKFKHTSSGSNGAVLVLKTPLVKEMIQDYRDDRIKNYVQKHSQSWEIFANKKLGRGVKPQQIILVTHCYRTSSWTSAVSVGVPENFGLKFSKGVLTANVATSRFTRSKHRGTAVIRSSPAVVGKDADQTVFVQGWKAKRFVTHFKDVDFHVPLDEVCQIF